MGYKERYLVFCSGARNTMVIFNPQFLMTTTNRLLLTRIFKPWQNWGTRSWWHWVGKQSWFPQSVRMKTRKRNQITANSCSPASLVATSVQYNTPNIGSPELDECIHMERTKYKIMHLSFQNFTK